MGKYELVIFDLDGVLIDSEIHYLEEIKKFMNINFPEYNICSEDLYSLVGKSWDQHYQILSNLINNTHSPDSILALFSDFEKNIVRDYNEWVFKDVSLTLENLKENGYVIALASNSSQKLIDYVMETTGLSNYFDLTVSGDRFKQGKPSPEIYQYITEYFNVSPRKTLVVEDSVSGISSGKSASCNVVAVYDRYFSMNQSQADFIIYDLLQIFEIL